jgi:predicted TIM-barrel fold metal-dependent hydrolase
MKRIFTTVLTAAIGMILFTGCQPGLRNNDQKARANSIGQKMDEFRSIRKIDIHTHISNDAPYFRKLLDSLNMKVATICTGGTNPERMNRSIDSTRVFTENNPRYYAWVTTFDLTRRVEPDWAEKVIAKLKDDFDHGAVGVKVWKDIGMVIKNREGAYIQLDDPMFDPIFEFIQAEGKTVLAHIGEPIDSWSPSHVKGKPQHYWARHPEFHFWDEPDKPSYSDIMAARDHVLDKYPDMRFVGAHMGSLSFDVNEIIKRLDRYPNFAVDIGGRTRYLMWQSRGKVRSFFMDYQDRIMYGTDKKASLYNSTGEMLTEEEQEVLKKDFLDRYNFFLRYYATDDQIPWANDIYGDKPQPAPAYDVQGLALPLDVLQKIYYQNAVDWFPGVDKTFN